MHRHFGVQLDGGREESEESSIERGEVIWLKDVDPARVIETLEELGYRDPSRAAKTLQGFRGASFVTRLEQKGRQRLDLLVPQVLRECGRHREPETVLERVVAILEAVGLRSAYLALLNENRGVLERLVELCGHSEFLARQISAHPLLLDELIDTRVLQRIPDRESLSRDLQARLSETSPDDDYTSYGFELTHKFSKRTRVFASYYDSDLWSGAVETKESGERVAHDGNKYGFGIRHDF